MYKWWTNYFPDNYNPDNYWPGYDAVAVVPGGSGMHRQRRYWDDRELVRQREDEELILMMAAWLA